MPRMLITRKTEYNGPSSVELSVATLIKNRAPSSNTDNTASGMAPVAYRTIAARSILSNRY